MSPQLIGGIGVCGLFSLLIIRVPVWAALMLVGFLGNVALIGDRAALATSGPFRSTPRHFMGCQSFRSSS
jgi:hypothetical protein